MEAALKIGGVSKEAAAGAAKAIVSILLAGYRSHADQETIRAALDAWAISSKVDGTTVSNCSFTMGSK